MQPGAIRVLRRPQHAADHVQDPKPVQMRSLATHTQVYGVLQQHRLPEEQLGLMQSSAQQGQRMTKRQRLSKELAQERAGQSPSIPVRPGTV